MPLPRQSQLITLGAVILLLSLVTVQVSQATPGPPTPTQYVQKAQGQILVLKTYPTGLPIPDSIDRGILESLKKGGVSVANLFIESLDLTRNPSKEHRRNLGKLLRQKMAGKNIGIVMIEGEPAVDFVATETRGLFPDAALITLTAPNIDPLKGGPRKVMDIPWRVDVAGTLRVAIDLFPNTRKVMVVTGAKERVLPFLEGAKKAFAPWQGKLEFEYTNEMTYEEMMRRISSLSSDTIVIYSPFFNDASGRSFVPAEVVVKVCQAAPVPVFSTLSEYLGHGIVGGSLLQTEMIGKQAGDLALAYLKGNLDLVKPVTTFVTPTNMMFDWRELTRWKADTGSLPKDSIIINRPSSLWNDYRGYVIGVLALVALQAGMILALLVMHQRIKKAISISKKNEKRFRDMSEMLPIAVFETDINMRLTFANQHALKLFGYSQNDIENDLNALNMLVPEDRAKAKTNAARRVKGEKIGASEYRGLKKDGSIFPIIMHTSPIIDQGTNKGLRGAIIDITEPKKSEDKIQKQKKLFETMFNAISDGIVITNTHREIQLANMGMELTFGYKPDELLGQPTSILYADLNKFREAGKAVFDKEAKNNGDIYVTYYRDKTGREFPGETIGAKLYDENDEWIGNLGIMRDVTERKRAEDALRNSEALYRTIAENFPKGALFLFDRQGRYVYANGADLRGSDSSFHDLQGKTVAEVFPPDLASVAQHMHERVLADETVSYETKFRGRIYENTAVPIHDIHGEVFQGLVIARDVTQQREMESQLRHAQKMEAVGTLAGGIAHDFNNILAAIMGYTEIALEEQEEGKSSQNELRGILQSTNRAKKLVQQILTFSRRADTQLKLVDVNHELLVAANLLKQALPKMIDIRLELSENITPVMGDPYQIEQILMNLGTNSRDAMPDGGSLTIATSQQTVADLTCRACAQPFAGDYVVITVTDTGEGMKKEDLERIFEPFFTTKEVGKGTGLGLATIFGTVRSHGGHITCTSELGKGTTFTIYLPPAEGEVEDVANNKPEEDIEGGQETVLLVDDEAHILDIGAQNLSRAGYEVITAPNGEEALEVFQAKGNEIDLVVLDLSMPGMGGHRCLQELLSQSPDLKVIVSTGYSRDGDLSETMSSGAAALLSKPFSRNEMLKTVRMVLDA